MTPTQEQQLLQLFGGIVVPVARLGKPLELHVNGVSVARGVTTEATVRQASRALSAALAIAKG